MRRRDVGLLAAAFGAGLPAMGRAQRVETLRFAPGATAATVRGSITGRDFADYVLGARAGQAMSVELRTPHPSTYFNVLPPGSEEALFIGSTSGTRFEGRLPASGEYRIRVYLMASAGRRGEAASYTLTVSIQP